MANLLTLPRPLPVRERLRAAVAHRGRLRAAPPWVGPLAALAGIFAAATALVASVTGGIEFASDAPMLYALSTRPFVLFESYRLSTAGPLWGSFPPLLPAVFGALVAPWSAVTDNFWAIRFGVLAWTGIVLFGLHLALTRLERLPADRVRAALWLFVLFPSVWICAAVIPQEEIYVAGFVLLLYWAARSERWRLVPLVLLATAASAKYFALILILPVAFASPRPWRNAIAWSAVVGAALGGYVLYHWHFHWVTPILDYRLAPGAGISLWALPPVFGFEPGARLSGAAGVSLAGAIALALAWQARRSDVPLVFSMAATLYVTVLCISTTHPAYELWALPLVAIAFARMTQRRDRVTLVALLGAWAVGEWGVNFFRGASEALEGTRWIGKERVAGRIEALLGADFPFAAAQAGCLLLVIAAGVATVALLWRAGRGAVSETAAEREVPAAIPASPAPVASA